MIHVEIRFFAGHRDIVGTTGMALTLEPGTTVGMLWERLARDYPRLQGYGRSLLYAINQEFATPTTELHDGDEVAFIPPVSGGTAAAENAPPLFCITEAPLDAAPLAHLVQTPADGAVVTFEGVVRNNVAGRETAYLTYEAYSEMALPVLAQLADEARTRWEIGRVAIHHRIGRLEIGARAVVVVVAAPHRQAAFQAAAYMMDRIKEVVPIWKCEHWADGTTEWQDGGGQVLQG
jgi:molybdopterin synthase catalytic subunit